MAIERYYDAAHRRLVYVGRAPSAETWDEWWRADASRHSITAPRNWFVVGKTRKYLAPGARVLDGGCGRGDKVYALRRAGFDAVGLDFAPATVRAIGAAVPDLAVVGGDVRRLPFADASFDGYWSLGVIEHFYTGYGRLLREIRRVLRPGGVLFLTFPSVSPLRAALIRRGKYPAFADTPEARAAFWQFALDSNTIVADFQRAGFALMHQSGRGGMIGVREEAGRFGPVIEYVETHQSFLPFRALYVLGNLALSPFAFHIRFLVFRRT